MSNPKHMRPGESADDLIEKFADVFHSFRDLHKITPLAFLAKLKKRGVALKRILPQTRRRVSRSGSRGNE